MGEGRKERKEQKMRVSWFRIVVVLGVAFIAGSASPLSLDPFLGVSPQDEIYYKTSSDTIACKDGSKLFTKSQLNDDYCDCPDGTDEPGTSACPRGKFFCRNAGHNPQLLFSSRVNDGICDCCDGSDEYDGRVRCPNTCWEAGKAARDKLKKKIATYQEGVKIRKQEVDKAKTAFAKDEEELKKLKNEEKILKGIVQQLKDLKEKIEKAEEKERLRKEKEEKEKREAEEAIREKTKHEEETLAPQHKHDESEYKVEENMHNTVGTVEDSPANEELKVDADDKDLVVEASPVGVEEPFAPEHQDDFSIVPEVGEDAKTEVLPEKVNKEENDAPENTEDLSREELGRLVASRWTRENPEKQADAKDNANEDHAEYTHDEGFDGYATDSDGETGNYDDTGKYDDDIDDEADENYEGEDNDDTSSSYKSELDDELDFSDTTASSEPSWLEKIQQTVRNIFQAVNWFQTPVDISEAVRIRKEYDESSSKLSKMQSRISSLTKKLKNDFGPEKEFYSFYSQCFESKQNKYVYKVCPYKQATQEEGHSTSRLGQWDKFEDSYRVMIFSNGDKCWNGPDRSVKIKLRCGLKNEIADVDEPSRCEYVALLSTPALCVEDKLKELQKKLDLMNQEEPQKRDEL